MTDAQLQGIGAQACNMCKRDLERDEFNFFLATYECDARQLHRMTKIEELIVQQLGENWLNSGRTKDIGFGILRECVDLMPPDAMIIASVTNHFRPTEKFDQLTSEQKQELVHSAHDRHHEAVAQGLLTLCDALTVVVQTPERVCLYTQDFDRHRHPVGKPDTHCIPQEQFGGRMKMFGEDKYAVSQ